MIGIASRIFCVALLSSLCPTARLIAGSDQTDLYIDTFCLPDGSYSLVAEDCSEGNVAGTRCTLRNESLNSTIWSKRYSFRLTEARITNDGHVFGYAFDSTDVALQPEEVGHFHIVLINPRGNLLLHEAVRQQGSRYPDGPDFPRVRGMMVDPDNDRAILRIADADVNRLAGLWMEYRVSTGDLTQAVRPKLLMGEGHHARFVLAAKPVVGTPLILIHWWRAEYIEGLGILCGAHFTLVDESFMPVWELEFEDDYEYLGGRERLSIKSDFLKDRISAIESEESGRFSISSFSESTCRTYAVQMKDDNWTVEELDGISYADVGEALAQTDLTGK